MSEATVHPVLAATTVSEQTRDLAQGLKDFYERHHVAVSVAGLLLVGMFVNRALIRRELTRLKFSVEVVADGNLVDLDQFSYIEVDD